MNQPSYIFMKDELEKIAVSPAWLAQRGLTGLQQRLAKLKSRGIRTGGGSKKRMIMKGGPKALRKLETEFRVTPRKEMLGDLAGLRKEYRATLSEGKMKISSMRDELEKIAIIGRAYRALRTGIKGGAKVTGAAWKSEAKKKGVGKALAKKNGKVIRVEHIVKKPLVSQLGAALIGGGLAAGGIGIAGGRLAEKQLEIHTGQRFRQPPYSEG